MFEQIQRRSEPQRQIRAGQWRVLLLPANAYHARYIASSASIGFAFDGQTGVHAYGSDHIHPFRAKPDSLAFVPQDCDVFSESTTGGEYLCLSHDVSIPDVAASEMRFNNVIDARAVKSAHALRNLMLHPDPADSLIIEYHALNLVDRVSQYLSVSPAPVIKHGAMTEQRLKLLDDLIEKHLAEGLTIAFLAKSVGVSEGYFSRAFRASVGMSPFNYIINRRVSKARELIQQSYCDLSDVANACGFSSHSHMTETFRRRLGLSPKVFKNLRTKHYI